jgi:hypothetical protein
MGWTSYRASYYKNGKIDRKAECDAYFMEGLNRGHFNVLKSSMVGSTYYAAIQRVVKNVGKDENGEYIYEPIPESERTTFAVVFLTSTNMKDYYNFAYKDMDEGCGPGQCDCPKGILDLLSPTDSQWANDWRKACYDNIAKKKNKNGLSKLPVGTIIKVTMPFDTNYFRQGQEVRLQKQAKWNSNRTQWITKTSPICRFTPGLMKIIEDCYEIIERGEAS